MDQEIQSSYHHLFLVAILLLPLLVVKLRRRNHGNKPPPGPWQLPVIGSLHHLVGALPHRAMRDLAKRHGPLMLLRLGELHVVVASSPDAAREVMKTHDAAFATRPRTATIRELTREGLGIAFAPHGEHWRQLRKLCVTELLSARRVMSLRRGREAEAANLVASVASSSKPVNMSALLATYVTDAVVRAVVGGQIRDRDTFLEKLDEGVRVAAGFSLADVFPSSRIARAFSGAARRAEAHHRAMTLLMDGVIAEHQERRAAGAGNDEEDLLDVLLRIQKDGGLQVPLDMGTIRAVIIVSSALSLPQRFRRNYVAFCNVLTLFVFFEWGVVHLGSFQRGERDDGDDAAVGHGGADAASGGAAQGAGRSASRARPSKPRAGGRSAKDALPAAGH
jgi:hypothetical protein